MSDTPLSKQGAEHIARTFTMMFNQVSMYSVTHPLAAQALNQCFSTLNEELAGFSPILLLMDREQFFVEDEPFNPRINTLKLADHFKKAGIQSISFEHGLSQAELRTALDIIGDLGSHSNVGAMIDALVEADVTHIRLNYVTYQKVTADDQIVTRDTAATLVTTDETPGTSTDELLSILASSVLMDNFEESLTLNTLIQAPTNVSRAMIAQDLKQVRDSGDPDARPGRMVADKLSSLRDQVDKALETPGRVSLHELAEAVFSMKRDLMEQIESHKAMGVTYQGEAQIRQEADELTDKVLVRLVCEEYAQGRTPVPRLALIIRRLIPEVAELQRLLPRLKTALLAEGMPLSGFLQLIRELGSELKNEELSQLISTSAEKIGLTGDDLIAEIRRDPDNAAELIHLAAEIRHAGSDKKALSDILVEYVERVGCEVATDRLPPDADPPSTGHMQEVLAEVRGQLLERLQRQEIQQQVLEAVEAKLRARIEENLRQFRASVILRRSASDGRGAIDAARLRQELEKHGGDPAQQQSLLQAMTELLAGKKVSRQRVQEIYQSLTSADAQAAQKPAPRPAAHPQSAPRPPGSLSRGNTLYFLNREILLAMRYKVPFAVLTFAVIHVEPAGNGGNEAPSPPPDAPTICERVRRRLSANIRETDAVGMLQDDRPVVLAPMTDARGAKIALKRILKRLVAEPYQIADRLWQVELAGVVTAFNQDRATDLKGFLRVVDNELEDMTTRLRHIKHLI